MKKTKVYYIDKEGFAHYLYHDGAGAYLWSEGGLPFFNVESAISYIRQLGEDDIHCELPKRERRKS
jgi:hypothetical protein